MICVHDMPFGAAVQPGGGVRYRLWAPSAREIQLCLHGPDTDWRVPLAIDASGWTDIVISESAPGTRYGYLIDGEIEVPDPASRFQPDDVHGSSEVIDPGEFAWRDDWCGRPWEEAVFYELHVGAFTPEGTFAGVIDRLDYLADLGVTTIELMPVADFPGRWNWGYDGAYPFAPDSRYGRPRDLKNLVQEAHARGLMVFLDVVYNHFGPEGNYLGRYAPQFFTDRYHTPWGKAIDFDGSESRVVRDFFIHNALFWLEEYNFDGLRLDAVHAIFDQSHPDFLTELAQTVRRKIAPERHVHLVLENDRNESRYLERDRDGRPRFYTAQWNDDLHHAAHVMVTGETAGYYADYADSPERHLGRTLAEGFAYQGDPSPFRHGARRGEPSAHLPPTAFIPFLQNHDQVGNRAFGERIDSLAVPSAVEAAAALILLSPAPPLLFMGEEWGAASPFAFFCDFEPGLAQSVTEGRRQEFSRFPEFQDEAARERIPDPNHPSTFASARLDWSERRTSPHNARLALYRRLLAIRAREIAPRTRGMKGGAGRARDLGDGVYHVDWRLGDGTSLWCVANLAAGGWRGEKIPAAGRLLYTTHDGLAQSSSIDVLPAWSAAWFITEPVD